LGLCSGAAQWVAGCETDIPASPTSILRPEVLERLGPCFAAEPAGDNGCQARLQSCVREAIMTGARPSSREAERCTELLAACEGASQPANYSHDQCVHILAASADGASREQVEAALGPTSLEPSACDATYLWPNMPFTPYFGSFR
jgi:hypothetical protein